MWQVGAKVANVIMKYKYAKTNKEPHAMLFLLILSGKNCPSMGIESHLKGTQ